MHACDWRSGRATWAFTFLDTWATPTMCICMYTQSQGCEGAGKEHLACIANVYCSGSMSPGLHWGAAKRQTRPLDCCLQQSWTRGSLQKMPSKSTLVFNYRCSCKQVIVWLYALYYHRQSFSDGTGDNLLVMERARTLQAVAKRASEQGQEQLHNESSLTHFFEHVAAA